MGSNLTAVKDMLEESVEGAVDALSRFDDRAMDYHTLQPTGNLTHWCYVDQIPGIIKHSLLSPHLKGQTLCFLGPSAIGKTFAVRQGFQEAAEVMGRPPVFHEMHVSQMGPTDVNGVPRDDGKHRTTWFPPAKFPLRRAEPEHQLACERFYAHWKQSGKVDHRIMRYTDERGESQGFPLYGFFWDEVTNPSSPSIVHQCFSLWYGNYVADDPLVDDTFHVLAGNRSTDGTNSINLANSATSRLGLIEAVPRLSGWMANWAMREIERGGEKFTNVHPLVIAYLHRNSNKFAPPSGNIQTMEPFPSPRTWHFVGDILYSHDDSALPDDILRSLIAARIGAGEAAQFWAWKDHWERVPDVNKLLNSPAAKPGAPFGWLPAKWPKMNEIDVLYVIATQMVSKLAKHNASRFMAFMMDNQKIPAEVSATAMKMLRPANKLQLLAHEWDPTGFGQWATMYRHYMF